ncbi:DUF4202 domain-containing protein [Aquimarina brevivitae]|uniref:Uncharacterized protein DUF4202 n=1 Tax=Aquimarina brevivitae TaxID=323412 RepID=A0A4Q7NZU2_9FLAO|nr:DUF4202 domain-containing protein [Aquimarina brevivitae]RZS92538.1 uncharacterized protein DUF4202 [Aquimarina brevivitae]
MNTTKLNKTYDLIDQANAEDPNQEMVKSKALPKELIYGRRMTQMLIDYVRAPSLALLIATRAQHICRWQIPRSRYPKDRVGYLQWREDLKKFHADKTSSLLHQLDYDADTIQRVSFLLQKKQLKKDWEVQLLEDVACLVFLRYYAEDFIHKHTDEKVVSILKKTWKKMSEKARKKAIEFNYSSPLNQLLKEALEQNS